VKKRSKFLVFLLVIAIVGLVVLQTPLMDAAREQAWFGLTVIVGQVFRVGPLTVPNNVAEQLATLKSNNVRLQAENLEYQRLSNQISAGTFEDFERVSAKVIARPIDVWRTEYIVNRGARDGLVLGAPAVITGSTLVGTIVELSEATAVMQLLTHPNSSLPAEILVGEKSGRGLVRGKSFTAVEMITIPRDVDVSVNQEVVTVAQPGLIPHGLSIGQVQARQDEEYEPYQRARLKVSYDPAELSAVSFLVQP